MNMENRGKPYRQGVLGVAGHAVEHLLGLLVGPGKCVLVHGAEGSRSLTGEVGEHEHEVAQVGQAEVPFALRVEISKKGASHLPQLRRHVLAASPWHKATGAAILEAEELVAVGEDPKLRHCDKDLEEITIKGR